MEIGRRAASSGDELTDAAFVDAHTAVHPVDLATVRLGERQQRRDLILGRGMVFFSEALAMHRVRMRRLRREGQRYPSAFSASDLEAARSAL